MNKQELEKLIVDAQYKKCTHFWHQTPCNGDENYMQHSGTFNGGIIFLSEIIESELEKGNDIRIILDLLKEIFSQKPFYNQ